MVNLPKGEDKSKMKRCRVILGVTVLCTLLGAGCGKNETEKASGKAEPVTITVWNYYTGAQQEVFDSLVEEFNRTDGKELGIVVNASSEGSIQDVENNVMDAVDEQVGARELPNIFAAYTDIAYEVDQKGMLADLTEYLTEEEKEEYIDSYIREGEFSGDGSVKIFPVAKATEVFMLNKTDWDRFSQEAGVPLKQLETMEGVTEAAQKYYEWTDSLTDAPDDGKAFFGRDAMANYMIIGSMQLGTEIFSVDDSGKLKLNLDKEIMRKLWDNYYVPYINGYFAAAGRFRSDDIKTGEIISFVGSSAGATFFPDKVILSDDESYDIETQVLPAPQFEKSAGFAIQQGAGMAVTAGSKEEIAASVEFLKWFTDTEKNIEFSIDSGYLPVKKEANDKEKIKQQISKDQEVTDVIHVSIDTVNQNTLYTSPAFAKSRSARNILEYSMSDKAAEDKASIEQSMSQGMSRKEAVSQFDTDENFEQWYDSISQELQMIIK